MGYFHKVVVDHVREIISGQTVGFNQNLIVKRIVIYRYIAVNDVAECRFPFSGDQLPDDVWFALRQILFNLVLRKAEAVPIVIKGDSLACP